MQRLSSSMQLAWEVFSVLVSLRLTLCHGESLVALVDVPQAQASGVEVLSHLERLFAVVVVVYFLVYEAPVTSFIGVDVAVVQDRH